MKIIKKLVIAIISVAFMLSSAGTVLADETVSTSASTTVDISKLSFDIVYGNQLPDFLNHQYEFDGQKIPLVESNYYFIITFVQLSQYTAYGYFPATADGYIDLTAPCGSNGETYADYFIQQAEQNLKGICIYKQRAIEAGMTLGDDEKKSVEAEIASKDEQQAKPAGVSLDYILKLYYGPDCDEKAYRMILENGALASKYQQNYYETFQVPEDQKYIPSVTYALFYAPKSSASDDDKKKAEASANEMLGQCKNIDDLKTMGTAAKSAGTCRDAGTVPVQKGKMVPAFEAWAYGSERETGEMDVIYADEYGYFCVGYNGIVEIDEKEKKDMASKALTSEISKEIKAGKYILKTNMPYSAAKPYESLANKKTDNNSSKILIIVFASIAGVAVVIVSVVLINKTIKENKAVKKSSKSGKGGSRYKSNGRKNGSSKSGSGKKSGNKKH